jgi:pimeloyl-ACP methyl ester carboxylesterase
MVSMIQSPIPPLSETVTFQGKGSVPLFGAHVFAETKDPLQPAVLLAHGFGQTRQSWSQTQSRLARAGHDSLSWDMRGHGESGRNPFDLRYDAEQFLNDVIAAAGLLPGAPVLVGASMGGLTGLMAQARQRLFSALVLVDVTPRWEAAGVQRIQAFMTAHPDGFDSFEHAAESISTYLPHRRERKTPKQLASLLRSDPESGQLRWHWDPRMLGEFVDGSEHLQDMISEAAASIDIPMLLISGGRSDLVSEQTVAHFLELAPHARHVQLPEATHMLAGDDNDAFIDTLLHFLSAQFPTSHSFTR